MDALLMMDDPHGMSGMQAFVRWKTEWLSTNHPEDVRNQAELNHKQTYILVANTLSH